MSAASDLLRNPGASAIALYEAAHRLVGDFLDWEPETLWLELDHQGVDVPRENRVKIMACQTLQLVPAFYWDAVVFEKTALALDGHACNPEALEEAAPAQLAWAVAEADWFLRRSKAAAWDFQHEPRAYAGVILARAGFALAPEELSFAQKALDRERHCGTCELRDEVTARWAKVSREHLSQLSLGEDRVDVQIARLAAVALHVRERRAAAERELGALG